MINTPSASWALQKSIHTALTGNAALTTLLGGARIYDEVPRNAAFPYISHGESVVRDWSTATDDGHEHSISIHVWTRGAGRKPAHDLLDCITTALAPAAIVLDGHRLISLQQEHAEVRRDGDGETWRGLLRLHATTEIIV
jgi:hypothetical protein